MVDDGYSVIQKTRVGFLISDLIKQGFNVTRIMKDRNGLDIKVGSKISVDKEKQPVFEVLFVRGTLAVVKCIDDKGDNVTFKPDDTLLIPEEALLRYETIES